ncbi:MAG: hypothetical protein BAJALOKI1v1_370006 [Promethearchaeota archaeon]|nr:MAG: hypothetical protein BAJALOKI1v1_370006 [Candidatus Lokiarchaeota archaeon]
MDYLCDTHLVEMYDNMPLNREGKMDIPSIINTNHYFQIFSLPFRDSETFEYFPASPFNLIENSQITVSFSELPYSTLVALDVDQHANYNFDILANQTTIPVNDANFNMITNLGLFTNTYDVDETIYQQGYLNLFYGAGTELDGEQYYSAEMPLNHLPNHNVKAYQSAITDNTPISWIDSYTFTNKFLTTGEIHVSGNVFYHQMFNLSLGSTDIMSQQELAEIIDLDVFETDVYFGIGLPSDIDITSIENVQKPESYILIVHDQCSSL